MDLGFYLIIAAIIGSRLFFVLLNMKEYLNHPLNIIKIWEGGLVFHGGLIASVVVGFYYLKKHRLNIWKYTDILAPALVLGQGIGRIGCLMAGCCYGKKTTLPWGIVFTDANSLAVLDVPLHPTQIYTSIGALCIFGYLLWVRKRKSYEGQVFWLYIALYSIMRFIVDIFRGDQIYWTRGYFFQTFTLTQVLSMVFFLSALYMLWYLKGKTKTATRP